MAGRRHRVIAALERWVQFVERFTMDDLGWRGLL
jgi:hypothetical protein